MLLGAVTVVVVVAGAEPGTRDPSTRAMEKALRTALGADAVVTVKKSSGESDEQLLGWATSEHANLLGIVTWSEEQRRATLRFVHPSEGRWADREIKFDAHDVPTERGRTVGFAFASMVPDDAIPPPAPPAVPPPVATVVVVPAVERPATSASPPRPPGRWSIEAAGTAASALGGYGGGIGGLLGVRYAFAAPLAFRVAVGARAGDIDVASASSRVYFGAAGLSLQPWFGRFGFGGRLDALLLGHEVIHLSGDDTAPAHLVRVVPGAAASLEGSWRFAEQASLFVGLGLEAAFGRTDIYIRDRLAAELSPVRVFGDAGVRVSF